MKSEGLTIHTRLRITHYALRITCVALAGWLLVGCTGQTVVTPVEHDGPYSVDVTIDPTTLNPPATASLNFEITDAQTKKPVVNFDPLYGPLIHNVLFSSDLLHFRHVYSSNQVGNRLTVFTDFPDLGGYYDYTMYKPAGADTQLLKAFITAGTADEHAGVELVKGPSERTRGWVTVQLITGPETIKKGEPVQLVFNVTQRGEPVIDLWPYLEAPGHLWIVNEHGEQFTHLVGQAEWRYLLPTVTPAATGTRTGVRTRTATPLPAATTVSGPGRVATTQAEQALTPSPLPTLEPDVKVALATITAMPSPMVATAQQTAQTTVMTPYVVPAIGYGPNLAFVHTFPEAGMYKMWLEIVSAATVLDFDFVVRVEE